MELLILCAVVFYAFIGTAPKELTQACLAMVWLMMILVTAYVFLAGAIKLAFN